MSDERQSVRSCLHKERDVLCEALGEVFTRVPQCRQAGVAIRGDEGWFLDLAENIREIFWIRTPRELLYVSPAYEEVWGRSRESLHADPDSFLEAVPPEDRGRIREAQRAGNVHGIPCDEEYRVVRPDQTQRWVRARSFPVMEEGRVVRTVGIAEDITERKRAEEFLRIERDLAIQLGSAANFLEALQLLLQTTLQIEGLDSGGIYLFEAERLQLVCHKGLSPEFIEQVSSYDAHSPHMHFVLQGEPVYWPNPTGVLHSGDLFEKEGLQALVVIPVKAGREVVSVLNLASHTQSEIPPSTRSALEAIAAQIPGVVARVRMGEALEHHSENLKEANAALRILLKQREQDRREFEESVLATMEHLVFPYLEKLKTTLNSADQRCYLGIVESHLREVTSPFGRKLSDRLVGLTPMEIRVADLIRQGKTSKEIAELLGTSEKAVLFHRQNIRGKLGLKNKKLNLCSYLSTLA